MRPLVFSRGPNRVSGIATNPWTSAGAEVPTFRYRTRTAAPASPWDWPVDRVAKLLRLRKNQAGIEAWGTPRSRNIRFPIPTSVASLWPTVASDSAGRLPGQLLSGTLATEEAADNITNYQLQSTPR